MGCGRTRTSGGGFNRQRAQGASNATRAPLDRGPAEHLLRADRLRAELNLIGVVGLGAAALIFDREGLDAVEAVVQFDGVGLASDTKTYLR